jgi:hypothetical protein
VSKFSHLYKHKLPNTASFLKLRNDLLGSWAAGETLDYYGNDNIKLYSHNLKNMPSDWYYKDKNITYKLNSLGHRCNEIDDINFDDYILYTGDSFSLGVGLELETTFPFLISNQLSKPYYNLGLGGTGLDVMFYNLNTWLLKYPKPKMVVIYYTHYNRVLIKELEHDFFNSFNANSNVEEHKKLIFYGDVSGYFITRFLLYKQTIDLFTKKFDIPFYHICFTNDYEVIPNNGIKVFDFLDTARDLLHAGIESHKSIANYIVSDYTDKYMNATIHSTP